MGCTGSRSKNAPGREVYPPCRNRSLAVYGEQGALLGGSRGHRRHSSRTRSSRHRKHEHVERGLSNGRPDHFITRRMETRLESSRTGVLTG
ncbi:hypothetical protein Pmar_PMAR011663 [Perkinsus marinus ATCC 50983]|uniref:Uncharacterized protein n=1 Tax=Perkinsus marinus (strain ATCC 50983 / TXsc) TaxID=423536 RepID=C5LCF2_PERM5|nr:hypothetical protein Pmar_PMAR011663 [Perkinsus marinus ATCC 50983]EER05635.1 hypothetical protein Pmar_PMAR011663 [Perkinsus marinus ATCC 50983]|eukprot:XP_002773819.1 hypothetical protein Pmar_PMAR011663 [Perkinsus marinus ATCC 50983]